MRWTLGLLLILPSVALADFRFVHYTDTHVTSDRKPEGNAEKDAELFREISALKEKPAFAINTGDVCETATVEEYANYRRALTSLIIPHYDAPGNHDVRWNPMGKEGFVRGSGQPLFQSWDHEAIHFVLLDSTVLLQHLGHFDQLMLAWLKSDLEKVGRERPVIIGFHHWIGRDSVMVDNEQDLIDLVAPYNVVLWLNGHGHSDIQWNINGVPAVMAKGLYQGSYHVVDVGKDTLTVRRRTANGKTNLVLTSSLKPQRNAYPDYTLGTIIDGMLPVTVQSTNSADTVTHSCRLDGQPYQLLKQALPVSETLPGNHVFTLKATTTDSKSFQRATSLVIPGLSPRWRTNVGGAVQCRLVRNGQSLFVTTMSGEVLALNPSTGSIKWRFKTGGSIFSTPEIKDGSVYFGSADHKIYALNADTGLSKWSFESQGAVFGGAAVAKGVVCIGSTDLNIYGLDEATGALRWKVPSQGMVQSKATTDGERFFIGSWDNKFRCLDASSGKVLWQNTFGKSFYFSPAIASPCVGDRRVFVGSNDGVLHAMDAETGKVIWEFDGKSVSYSAPLLSLDRLYISLGNESKVFCFDAESGSKIWESQTGHLTYDSSFAKSGSGVFIGSNDGTFTAFEALTGKVRWQYFIGGGHLLASPATDEDSVFIASMGGDVVALPLNK